MLAGMAARFIDGYRGLLLDMGRTFMFEGDRFGDGERFAESYAELGGWRIEEERVVRIVRALFSSLIRASDDSSLFETFPAVREQLESLPEARGVPSEEKSRLAAVFARHEIGTIPETCATALKELAGSHVLGVVSNIWSPPQIFLDEFDRAGVRGCFETIVFSSDHRCIKPSPRLIGKALGMMALSPQHAAFVGDSWERDLQPARALGMGTIHVTREATAADCAIGDLADLLSATRGAP